MPSRTAPSRLKRSSVVELVVDKVAEAKLKLLCSLSSKLWNEVSYARRRMFFETGRVDLKSTYKEFYEKYKTLIGSATAQQVLNKNDEAWRSFLSLLKLKRERKLPQFISKINPPGYRKRGDKRELWAILRKDQYRVEGDRIILKGLGAIGWIELKYKGLIHLREEQGRLEIRYDQARRRWYAHIAFEASEKAVRGEWTPIPAKPKGGLTAGIDIGVNNLMAVYVESGLAKLVNGRPLKAISHYWRSRIAGYQSKLNKCGSKTSRKLKAMYSRWRSQIKSYVDSRVRQTIEWLHEAGVSVVKVGYPKYIAQKNGNFNNTQVWTYRYLLKRIKEVAEEYGMTAVYMGEAYSSTTCPVHRDGKCVKRVKRGLLKCTLLNKVFNADLVGAYNILTTPITPSPPRGRGNGPKTRPGATSPVAPNLPALTGGTLAL